MNISSEKLEDQFMTEVGVYHRAELMKAVMDGVCPDPNPVEQRALAFAQQEYERGRNDAVEFIRKNLSGKAYTDAKYVADDVELGFDARLPLKEDKIRQKRV